MSEPWQGDSGAGRKARSWVAKWGPAGVAALLAMGLVGLGARQLPGSGASRPPVTIGFDLLGALAILVVTLAGIILLAFVVLILWPSDEPIDLPGRSRARYWAGPLLIVGVVAVLTLLPSRDGEPPAGVPAPGAVTTAPAPSGGESSWGFVVLVGAMGLALVAVTVSGRVRREREPGEAVGGDDAPESAVPEYVGVSDDLLAGDGPRAQVIRSYVEMMRACTRVRVLRMLSETPREFLDRALRGVDRVDAPAVRLTELFEEARFSRRPVTAADAAEAGAAAELVRRELESSW